LELLATHAVGILGRYAHLALVADLHPGDGVVEAADHGARAELELDRLAVAGTVEHRPVLESAGVVHGDGVALFRLTAHARSSQGVDCRRTSTARHWNVPGQCTAPIVLGRMAARSCQGEWPRTRDGPSGEPHCCGADSSD